MPNTFNFSDLSFATASFINDKHHFTASRLIEVVKKHITLDVHCLTNLNQNLEIKKKYFKILKRNKIDITEGYIWKPWFILSLLNKLPHNSICFYLDAGAEISTNPHALEELKRLFVYAKDNGSIFFRNNYDSRITADEETLDLLSKYFKEIKNPHHSVVAGCMILRNDKETRSLIRKWCYLSIIKKGQFFIGNRNLKHRHDQFVLSGLLNNLSHTFCLLKKPIWFSNFFYLYPSTQLYPIHTTRFKKNISFINNFTYLRFRLIRRIIILLGLENFIFRFLFFIKNQLVSMFYFHAISPELLDYEKILFYENDESYFKTSGDNILLNNKRKKIKGLKIKNSFFFHDGLILTNGIPLISHKKIYGEKNLLVPKLKYIFGNLRKKEIDNAVLCLNSDSNNIYHFIYDCFLNSLDYFNDERVVLINEGLDDLKKELFNLLGFKTVFVKKNQLYFVKKAYLYDLPDYAGFVSKDSLIKLKNFFYKKLELKDEEFNKNYFIKRSETEGRKIILSIENEKILLDKYNFEFVDLSKKNIKTQMKIFCNAKNIIAPHGAGLSWIFLSTEKTSITEIRNVVNNNNVIEKIAKKLKLNYNFFYPSVHDKKNINKKNITNPNLPVDEFIFGQIIENIK